MRRAFLLLAILLAALAHGQKHLHVFAAASLKEPFQRIARGYEQEHSGVKVLLSFAGSQQLAAQIQAGAPCDVFAAASESSIQRVKLQSPYWVFAKNRLALIAPKGSAPLTLKGLGTVKSLVLAAPAVPAGQYANKALESAAKEFGGDWLRAVRSHIVSQEQDVRSVLAKVQIGEADAGIVYVTDAMSAKGKVESYPFGKYDQVATYPIGIPARAPDPEESRHFIHAITESAGQSELAAAGFLSPLEAAGGISVEGRGRSQTILLPQIRQGRKVSFHTGRGRTMTGWPVAPLLRSVRGKVGVLVGADRYSVSVPFGSLRTAYLVEQGDGNLQIILPSEKPAKWVKWLRRIEIR